MQIDSATSRRIAILDPFRVTDAVTNFDPNSHFSRGSRQILAVQYLKSGVQEWAPIGGTIDTATPNDGPAACVAGVSTAQWEHSPRVCSVKHELQFQHARSLVHIFAVRYRCEAGRGRGGYLPRCDAEDNSRRTGRSRRPREHASCRTRDCQQRLHATHRSHCDQPFAGEVPFG